MKGIRRFLTKVLGVKRYLFLVSKVYIRMISMNFYKKKYPEIHFLKNLIKPHFVSIDIGANLGYYSTMLSRLSIRGKVYCVEPIPLFAEVWKKNTANCGNVHLLQLALGSEKAEVKMSIPIVDGIVRHGLSKVVDHSEDNKNTELTFSVQMDRGDTVFKDITPIDFIKCDIEGYEQFAISSLLGTIKRHRPIIQIELNGEENRSVVYRVLSENEFSAFILRDGTLRPIDGDRLMDYHSDFYFIANETITNYSFIKM